ncbi:MAG: isopeptide-forming domain-containing fimbrial protein [Lachnospiraceae bacterium]|nr:isopeptide-forming domain-containing fimbrial protein [Lachnospiraceae bacterium]
MSKLKKVLAVVLSMAMILATSVTAFAATGVKPAATDVKTATVSNVEKDATVTAYKVVEANYNTAGFTGYTTVAGVTIANPLAPTSDEIAAIANMADKSGLTSVAMTAGTADENGLASFTADLTAGSWMVLVTGTVNEVYNPMLVSNYYSVGGSDSEMAAGTVDANSNWTLVTTNAYAKSTAPTIDKTIVGGDKDVAIGDTVNFQIATNIPSYSKDYTEVVVKISDVLSTGLTLDTNTIKVNIPEDDYDIESSTTGFTITVDSAYALAHGTEAVTVTYSATVNDQAGINFDANTNTATLEYSNDPSNSANTKTTDDKTYTYTFGIDASLNGSSQDTWNKVTEELVKGEIVKQTNESGVEEEVFKALAGATFTLTNNATDKVYTATSDVNGALAFTGLDAGTYTLVETAAPAGYTVNTKEIPVVISATYNEDGTLASYTITVDGEATSTYTATYTGTGINKTITTVVTNADAEATQIVNTKISTLPSTGGIGTTIFTIGGCLIMILAAAFFFISRKKASAQQ